MGLIITGILFAFGLLLWLISPPPTILPPLSVDLPFDSLISARRFMLAQAANSATILSVLGAISLAIVWLLALRKRRVTQALSASVVMICGLLALQAQVWVMRDRPGEGALLYCLSGVVFLMWAWVNQRRGAPKPSPGAPGLSRRVELACLTLVLAVAMFGRIYELKRVPYGIDGDEGKWTVEVVSVMIDGQDTLSSEYHRRLLPMSFWMEAPFQSIMGAGLTPARLEVAIFSVIAVYMFYRLVRTLYDAPTALVAALLLAVSLLDMTASRVANVESHVRLWAILPFFGLAVALRTHRVRHFLLTGFAVAGAMLTYETLIPIVAAVLTLAIGAALRDWRAWRAWLPRLAALMTAPAAVAAVTIDYLFGRMGYYLDFRGPATDSTFGEQLARGVEGLFKTFYSAPLNDAVYNRDGPIINGLLVPLLVLGILYAVVRARRQSSAFALTWLAWAFLPVPVILHTPLPRVLYPGLPVLYIFIAIALVVIFRTIANAVQLPRLAAPIGVLALSGFALLNLTIWFQEVQGTPDEIRRRQVSEIVAANVAPDGPLWMPHYRLNETVDVERETMGLMIRERRRTTNAGEYGLVLYNDLLPALSRQGASYLQLKVLIDNSQPALPEERQRIIDAFNRCYPMAGVTPTTYFDLYHLTHTDLSSPACRSAPLKLAPPPGAIEGGAAARIAIGWSLDSASASQSELTCRRDRPDVVWIEAESFVTLSAWITDTRFVTGWSGQGYLADDWRSEYAATGADVPKPGTYRLWVRTYRRQADDFPAFMEINGQTLTFAEPDPAALNVWRWQSLADLRLNAGPLLIRLTRPFDQARAPFIALFVDTIVLSADPKFDPNHDERRLPALHTRGADAGQQRQGSFTIQLASGRYQCVVTVSDGDRLVDSSGATGITSDPVYFEVKP